MRSFRLHHLILALAAAACLSGCAEGRKVDAENARDWLPGALPQLQRVIVLLRTCQPLRPSGYNRIWANGDDGGAERAHCKYGPDGAIGDIQTALHDAGVLGVDYAPSADIRTPVSFATFLLFREGMVTSGSSIAVEYHSNPQPCRVTRGGDQTYVVVQQPITAAPCRWFWDSGENNVHPHS